ncbi:MAG TPA: hypothetical protein VHA54_11530 [Solirubrobacterales bacterium]|nr:hypothetical protein [Solirubrobacterales bacterium]
MKPVRWGAAALAVCCLGLALAPGAWAQGRIDRSFGKDGVVDLGAELVGERWLGAVGVAPDGGIFVTEDKRACARGGCPSSSWLKRYRPDGRPDRSFDAGPAPVATGTPYGAELTVDAAGRPVLSWTAAGRRVVVRRLRRDGGLDRRFGKSGSFALPCGCRAVSVAPSPGGGLLIAGARDLQRNGSYRGTEWIFAQLRPDGSLDPRFGRGGVARRRMVGFGPAEATPAPGGGAILTGHRCCRERYPSLPFVGRISARGGLERRFAAAARRSIHGVAGTRPDDFGWDGITPIFRSRGRIDVFAGTWGQAVTVRLRGDGRRDLSFGREGVGLYPLKFGAATADGAGGSFVVGYRGGGFQVRRVGRDGRLDRRFGRVPLRGAYNEEGLSIYAAGRGRAIVLARDEAVCREVCPSDPKLYRVVAGR